MVRIAKGSGTRPEEVNFLLEEYKKFAKMVSKMGGMNLNSQTDLKNVLYYYILTLLVVKKP
jgi:signal recognition particle subunit SRP54